MSSVDERYEGYFRALRAFNKQDVDVRRRVVGEYFDIAAIVLPDEPRARLRLYGLRKARRLPGLRTGTDGV